MTRVALVDADSILWAQLWLNKDKSDDELRQALDAQISDILTQTKADKYIGFLKNPNEVEFRRRMFPSYKSTRPDAPDWYTSRKDLVREYLINTWKFVYTVKGYESDDSICSVAYAIHTADTTIPIICSVDKDMRQYPGWNYNLRSKELMFSSHEEADKFMLTQILTGDSTDAIKGVPGIGPAKAKKLFDTIGDYNIIGMVYDTYYQHHGDTAKALIDFAENVLQVVMRRDLDYPYELVDVPEYIKGYNPETLFK